MEVARAEAEKTKMIGSADAYAIESVGKAEAEGMRMKAAAYKQYGDAAVMSLVLDALPKVYIDDIQILFYINIFKMIFLLLIF